MTLVVVPGLEKKVSKKLSDIFKTMKINQF